MKYSTFINRIERDIKSGELDIKKLKKDLKDYSSKKYKQDISIDADRVVKVMSEITGIKEEELKKRNGKREMVTYRAIMYSFLIKIGYRSTKIGIYFKYDHATVLHLINKLNEQRLIYTDVKDVFDKFNSKINELCF